MKQISDYKNNDELRSKFNNLTLEIFGLDFEDWYQRGFWDNSYVCHSFFEDDQIISNVSASKFELIVSGEVFQAIQIGTVMTKKEFRGKGLAVELTKIVIDKYRSDFDFFYLFAHDKVWDYYKKQGFIPIDEYGYSIEIKNAVNSNEKLRKLDMSNKNDLQTIIRLTKNRKPVSKTFGILNNTSIFLFYALTDYYDNLFYSDSKDCLLVFTENKDRVVHLYDILSESELDFAEITALICSEIHELKKIIFHYTPDYADIVIKPTAMDSNDRMFFKGDPAILPLKFLYPKIGIT